MQDYKRRLAKNQKATRRLLICEVEVLLSAPKTIRFVLFSFSSLLSRALSTAYIHINALLVKVEVYALAANVVYHEEEETEEKKGERV